MSAPSLQSAPTETTIDPDLPLALRPLARALLLLNRALVGLGMVALLVASLVLTSSVVTRYALKASTDWQDEAAVFCLVGATFLCSAYVQSLRGHIGIEALAGVLPAVVNRVRLLLVDLLTVLFVAFFAWKSWTLFHEAWHEGQTTSSSWAPPLWIPYGLMAAGMSLLTVQVALQLVARCNGLRRRHPIEAATHAEASVGTIGKQKSALR